MYLREKMSRGDNKGLQIDACSSPLGCNRLLYSSGWDALSQASQSLWSEGLWCMYSFNGVFWQERHCALKEEECWQFICSMHWCIPKCMCLFDTKVEQIKHHRFERCQESKFSSYFFFFLACLETACGGLWKQKPRYKEREGPHVF